MILKQRPEIVDEGDTVSLICSALANPSKVNYTWDYGNYESYNKELVLPGVNRHDNGKLVKCQAENSLGAGEETHKLNVHCEYRQI